MNFENYYPFTPAPLPYDFTALKPYISEYTMYFHHDKHYKDYVDKLNSILADSPFMQNVPLEVLTKTENPELRKNAGGVYNHELFFASVSPEKNQPSEKMSRLIADSFGSEAAMRSLLNEMGTTLYGSGYLWLAENLNGVLELIATPNQDTIDFDKFTPLLNIDLWEHAYYLDRQNRRREYLNAVWEVIDWKKAEDRLK